MLLKKYSGYIPYAKILHGSAFFAIAFIWNDVMTGTAMYRERNMLDHPSKHPALPDVGFDLIPIMGVCEISLLPTYFLFIYMLTTLFRMMIFNTEGILEGVRIFIRFCIVDGMVLFVRGTTVAITSLNNPWKFCDDCDNGTKDCPRTWIGCVIETAFGGFPFFDCGDMIFSGHTVHFMLCFLIWIYYYKGSYQQIVKGIAFVVMLGGFVVLLSCRYHYSIDILIGIYVVIALWYAFDYMSLRGKIDPKNAPEYCRAIYWLDSFESEL